jgi:hypothetical protein
LQSLRLPRPRTLRDWGAAALVAAALFTLPFLVLGALEDGGARWIAPVTACAAVLIVHAWRQSSPLVVLGAVVGAGIGAIGFAGAVLLGDTCGGSSAAGFVKWLGALVIALWLGAVGVRGGLKILWVTPLALIAAGLWVLLAAHVVPGGAAGCFFE